jgi:hypothetical protein
MRTRALEVRRVEERMHEARTAQATSKCRARTRTRAFTFDAHVHNGAAGGRLGSPKHNAIDWWSERQPSMPVELELSAPGLAHGCREALPESERADTRKDGEREQAVTKRRVRKRNRRTLKRKRALCCQRLMLCTLLLQSWLSTFDDEENEEGPWQGNEKGLEEAPEKQGTQVRPLPCARVTRVGKSLLTGRKPRSC